MASSKTKQETATAKTVKPAKSSSITKNTAKTTAKSAKVKHSKHENILHKIFGGLNMSWPVVIIMAIALGLYTALMALFVPDGNSFHDIAATPEWWVLPAIIIIVNCKKPLEAALKVFVFFLISQPLVYLIQVPFSYMGWGIFQYYPFWFKITLATFPAGFIGWYMKKDKWYSGLILSSMTVLLAFMGVQFVFGFKDSFPNHLLTAIYCFAIIPVFILGIFKKWQPRVVSAVVSVVAIIAFIIITILDGGGYYETYRTGYDKDGNMFTDYSFVGEAYVSFWSGSRKGSAEVINTDDGYTIKLTGQKDYEYRFAVTDESGTEYYFRYYFNKDLDYIMLELEE